ncbi:MAG TPA: hypothetical protein VMF10_10755 [Candidatus Aquilonibacter sp.]|nr:hypothetical protein [Candidatus Aquilonibacter sp.]
MNRLFQRSQLVCGFVVCAAALMAGQTSVLTWHNNNWRDGLNSTETVLNESNVNSGQFGKVCQAVVDGQIFAQPLVVSHGGNNTVYIATMNDSIYEINGSNCSQIAQVSLLEANEVAVPCATVGGPQCYTVKPIIGILGTPVIDSTTNTIYLVTETESTAGTCATSKQNSCFTHRLHALDVTTLAEKFGGPINIAGSYQKISFTSVNHIQRPGLLLLPKTWQNGDSTVYIAFSEMDGSGVVGVNIPRGWIFAFDAYNLANAPIIWSSTPGDEGGGLWMSGAGLAAGLDSPGGNTYLYVATGDGDFTVNTGGADYGDSFVKLTTNLTTVPNGYFTPYGQACMNVADEDFGSGGVMLIPDSGSTYWAIAAGKDKNIYALNRANPGGFTPPTNTTCPATGTNKIQEYFTASSTPFFTTAAYWNSALFYAPIFGPLSKYEVSATAPPVCHPYPICQNHTAKSSLSFQYGTNLSISSSGNTNGTAIVWLSDGNTWPGKSSPSPAPVILYAYDAQHITSPQTIPELWDSTQCPARDQPGNATKFAVPTVANGLVYLGTMDPTDTTNTRGELDVFGPTTAVCN